MWDVAVSAWDNWDSFVEYTQLLNPRIPGQMISFVAITATFLEILFGLCLLLGFKTEFFAKLSGILLLLFGLSMTFSTGIKGPLDYSVFTASAAAFTLSTMGSKYLELDEVLGIP